MNFTVVGAGGFIGTALADRLQANGHTVERVGRGADLFSRPLGHLIYAAGITADFRRKPAETVDAHVNLLLSILRHSDFNSLLYLSSTRVYRRSKCGEESALLSCIPEDPEDLYNLSKALGESLCLSNPRSDIRVVRLANVIGGGSTSPSFFAMLLDEAQIYKCLRIESAPNSAKDYITLQDVLMVLPEIAIHGRERVYNLASGVMISNAEIAALFEEKGVQVEFTTAVVSQIFPTISNRRIREEFGFYPEPVLPLMEALIYERLKKNDQDRL